MKKCLIILSIQALLLLGCQHQTRSLNKNDENASGELVETNPSLILNPDRSRYEHCEPNRDICFQKRSGEQAIFKKCKVFQVGVCPNANQAKFHCDLESQQSVLFYGSFSASEGRGICKSLGGVINQP